MVDVRPQPPTFSCRPTLRHYKKRRYYATATATRPGGAASSRSTRRPQCQPGATAGGTWALGRERPSYITAQGGLRGRRPPLPAWPPPLPGARTPLGQLALGRRGSRPPGLPGLGEDDAAQAPGAPARRGRLAGGKKTNRSASQQLPWATNVRATRPAEESLVARSQVQPVTGRANRPTRRGTKGHILEHPLKLALLRADPNVKPRVSSKPRVRGTAERKKKRTTPPPNVRVGQSLDLQFETLKHNLQPLS